MLRKPPIVVTPAVNPRPEAVLAPDAAIGPQRHAASTQHDQKEVSWDAQSPYRLDRIPRRNRLRHWARPRFAADKRDRQPSDTAESGNAADERRDERHELRHHGLRLTGDAEADNSAHTEGMPRLVGRPKDRHDDAAASQARPEAVDPRSGRRRPPADGVRRPYARAHGRADDDEPRHDARVREEGRRHGGEDRRPGQQLAAGGDSRLTRRTRLLVYLTEGRMPARATTTTVVTDTNCAADRNGISHCANILRLGSGRRITVRHDHSMMNDPCLSPGERVRIKIYAEATRASDS